MMKPLLPLLMLFTTHVFSATAPYPPLNATTLDAQQVSSKAKVTYLKFWATWCAYCVEEMPLLEQSYQQANDGYQVIAINIGFNQSQRGVVSYLKKHDYQFPTVFDSDGSITRQYQVLGTPQHILLDGHGNELYRSALFTDELANKLSKLQGSR
ncbi:TlpA disulfide reductase family protein [Pseudoalteromonas luteoviolacea]|nr:TlpA disulfide reductase family protein [Pseudoalteromonas luteoviolacea]